MMNNYSGQRSLDPDPISLSSAYIFMPDPVAKVAQDSLDTEYCTDPAGQALNNLSGFFNPAYFASYGNRDLSLSASAPDGLKSGGMDYKTLLPYLLYDRRGKLRPVSGGWSMGAYQ